MTVKYPVFFTEIDGCVLVEIPDFKMVLYGTDIDDARDEAKHAIELCYVTYEELKGPIPEPSEIALLDISKSKFYDDKRIVSLLMVEANPTEYRKRIGM